MRLRYCELQHVSRERRLASVRVTEEMAFTKSPFVGNFRSFVVKKLSADRVVKASPPSSRERPQVKDTTL